MVIPWLYRASLVNSCQFPWLFHVSKTRRTHFHPIFIPMKPARSSGRLVTHQSFDLEVAELNLGDGSGT